MKDPILTEASKVHLAEAVQENLYALLHAMQALPGTEAIEDEQFSMLHARPDNPMFRSVWRTRFPLGETEARIAEAVRWFRQREAPSFLWWTDAHTAPADMAERLLRAGFDGNLEGDQGMAANLHELNDYFKAPDQLKIVRALDQQTLEDWSAVFSEANDMPKSGGQAWVEATQALGGEQAPWRLYVGYLDGQAVGSSMLFNAAGVAGIYSVGTLKDRRGQGIGGVMTLQPLLEARREGFHYAVLFASWQGRSVYRRLGFHEVPCKIGIYYKEIEERSE